MGHGRPSHSRRSRASDGESAVTPVIGAILILAITVLGIAGVLYWGAPMIDRIQAQNAQVAVVGEFNDLRDASSVLSVPDHSRFPTIVIPRGDLNLERGSRIMVTSDRDTDPVYLGCDFHVLDWADTTAPTQVTVKNTGCRTGTLVISSVSGGTLVQVSSTALLAGATAPVTVVGSDFSAGDWVFRLTSASCPGNTCAEAWIHSSDRITWALASPAGTREVSFDVGAIFSDTDGSLFLEREATVGDGVFGSSYYGLWLRSLTAGGYTGISGAGSHQVYLSLLGNYDRAEATGTSRLRIDVAGDLAQAWCNSFLSRNLGLSGSSYQADPTVSSCAAITTDGVRSVCYSLVTANACTSVGSTFTFRFLHARIYTSLVI